MNQALYTDELREVTGAVSVQVVNKTLDISKDGNSKMKKPINQCSDWSCEDWCR